MTIQEKVIIVTLILAIVSQFIFLGVTLLSYLEGKITGLKCSFVSVAFIIWILLTIESIISIQGVTNEKGRKGRNIPATEINEKLVP